MNLFLRPSGRSFRAARPAALALLAFSALTGCNRGGGGSSSDSGSTNSTAGGSPPVIARVAGDPITREEFYSYVEHVPVQTVAQVTAGMDAGQVALVDIIRRKLTDKLAESKKLTPSDADVMSIVNFARRSTPKIDQDIKAGRQSEAELKMAAKTAMEQFAVGTNGDKPKPEDVQKAYTAHAREFNIVSYSFRALNAPTPDLGKKAIAKLKAGGTLKDAAQILGYPPQVMTQIDRVVTLQSGDPNMQAILPGLETLKPNEVSAQPLAVQTPQSPTGVAYVILQLVSKQPVYTFKQEEVKPILEQIALRETHKDANQHFQQELAAYTSGANIEIYVDRYKPLLEGFIRAQAASHTATSPGGSLNPGAGGTAPPSGSTGGTGGGSALTPPPSSSSGAPSSGGSTGGSALTPPPAGAGAPK